MLYLGIFLFIVICLLFIPLKIGLIVKLDDRLLDFSIKIYILKIIRVYKKTINIPDIFKIQRSKKNKTDKKKKEKKPKKQGKLTFTDKKNLALKIFCKVKPKLAKLFNYLKNKFKIRNVDLNIMEGTGDAATTATTYGALWSIIGCLTAITNNYLNITTKNVEVKCDFNNKTFKLYLGCIFSFSIVNIITIVLRIVIIYFISNRLIKNEITGGGSNE